MASPLVLCENLVKIYKVADLEVVALLGLNLDIMAGEMVAIMGASGSGKSTLLNVLGGLDIPSGGHCIVAGNDVTQMTQAERLRYRRQVIGHVWQHSGRNLVPHYTLAQNLGIPQLARGIGPPPAAAAPRNCSMPSVWQGWSIGIPISCLGGNSNAPPSLSPSPIALACCWQTNQLGIGFHHHAADSSPFSLAAADE